MSYKNPIQWSMIYKDRSLQKAYYRLLQELAHYLRHDVGEIENAIYYCLCPSLAAAGKKRTACYKKFQSIEAMKPYLLKVARREIHKNTKAMHATVSLDQQLHHEGGIFMDFLMAEESDRTLEDKIDWLYGCLKGIAQNRRDDLAPLAKYLVKHWGKPVRQREIADDLGVNQSTVSRGMKELGTKLLARQNQ